MNRSFATAGVEPAGIRSRARWLANGALKNLALTLPFLLLYWADLIHHELWLDELNAWGIAAASPTIGKLLYYLHFEGHPWLWYVILWIPTRFTHDPSAMKWVEALFGTAIYLVLGMLSPFTRVQKLLIFASYFVVFEYTVLTRMYSVMLLLALWYVWRRMREPDGYLGNVVLLGFLANTDMTGLLLSGALLLEYGYDRWMAHRASGWTAEEKRRAWGALGLYVGLLALSIGTLLPSPDISWQIPGRMGSELTLRRLTQSVANMTASPWWPISKEFPHKFWYTNAMENKKLLLLMPVVVFAYWRIFRRERNLQLLMALTIFFGALFAWVVHVGRVRHWGIAVVSFLVALWMQRVKRERAGDPRASRWSPWAYGLMGLGALAGMAAVADSWTHPFSEAGATAQWIRTHEPADVPLVSDWDLNLVSVAEELQRPVYFMECACTGTFKLFSHERDQFPYDELPERLNLAMNNLGNRPLVMVNSRPLLPNMAARLERESLSATPLATFSKSEEEHQNFYLYRVTRVEQGNASVPGEPRPR